MPDNENQSIPSALDVSALVKPVKFIHREPASLPTFTADGAWLTLNHANLIRLGFYTENPITPTSVIQPVNPDGTITSDQTQQGLYDPEYYVLVRDFQCNVVLTLPTALQIYQTLGHFIRGAQQQMNERTQTMVKAAAEKKASEQAK